MDVAGVAGPVGISAGQNGSDRPGTAVANALDSQGEALDTPVEAPGETFDGEFYAQVSVIVASYNDSQPDLGFAGGLITGNVVNFRVTDGDGDRIANAEEPGTAFRDAVEAGDVRISGRGFWSGGVWFVVNRLRDLVGAL